MRENVRHTESSVSINRFPHEQLLIKDIGEMHNQVYNKKLWTDQSKTNHKPFQEMKEKYSV